MKLLLSGSLLLLLGFLACSSDERPLVMADQLLQRGIELLEEESFAQAEVQFAQAIRIYTELNQLSRLAEAQGYLARVYLAESQFSQALESVDLALEYCRRDNYFRGEAQHSLLRGDILAEFGDPAGALEPYRSSRALSAAFGDKPSVARVDLRLGRCLLRLGRYEEALAALESALAFYRSEDEDAGVCEALTGVGEVYAAQQRGGEALNSLLQALDLVDRREQPDIDARIHLAAGEVHRRLGDRNAALRYFRDGANRLRASRMGKRYEVLLMFRIGAVYLESGRFEEARSFFSTAASAAKAGGDRLAEHLLYLFVLQASEGLIPEPQRASQRERLAQSYSQLADRFREIEYRSGESLARHRAGTLLEEAGKWSEALVQYQQAVQAEEGRFGEFVSSDFHAPLAAELGVEARRSDWYASVVSGLIDRRRMEEAFLFLQRGMQREQFRVLGNLETEVRYSPVSAAMEEVRRSLQRARLLQTELGALLAARASGNSPAQIGALRRKLDAVVRSIGTGAREISLRFSNALPLVPAGVPSLAEIQSAVPRGSVVVHHLVTERRLLLFALTRTDLQLKIVPVSREQVEENVREYLSLLHDPSVVTGAGGEASVASMTKFAVLSSALYDLLVRPVDQLLDRSVIIIPTGILQNVPFHAFERQESRGTVRYLIEITNVDYLPSFASLRFRTASAPRVRDLVAVGDPGGKNWSVDYELRDLRSFFKDVYLLLGAEATWDRVRNVRGDVFQLATGFSVGPGTPPLGTFTLADPNAVETTVEVPFHELTGISAFPLVVLSNHLGSGGGLGPLHALLLRSSGTSDVFLNVWSADRKASKFFSEFFFTHLSEGLASGDAFRQALLNMIQRNDMNHPHQWGQFFHFGTG